LAFNGVVCVVEILRVEMSIREYFVSTSDFRLRIFYALKMSRNAKGIFLRGEKSNLLLTKTIEFFWTKDN